MITPRYTNRRDAHPLRALTTCCLTFAVFGFACWHTAVVDILSPPLVILFFVVVLFLSALWVTFFLGVLILFALVRKNIQFCFNEP